MTQNLLAVSTHFPFGENWNDYSKIVDERRIDLAVESVRALVGNLSGKSFLDIGSGSGLFSVAALRLGAKEVLAIDVDPVSVATSRELLSRETSTSWAAIQASVFDLPEQVAHQFDVVYSWGVLHHTGDMWRAIDRAALMVKPGAVFALALYERTPLCGIWAIEKRLYCKLPKLMQALFRGVYLGAWGAGMLVNGRNPLRLVREARERGMDTANDVHDWLGGYPYESTTPPEVEPFMRKRGFEPLAVVPWPVRAGGMLGSGCTEYVFRRNEGKQASNQTAS